jgi:hypothetical protein
MLIIWPLVITIEDCHVPQSAAVTIKLWAMDVDDGGLGCDN